MILSAIISVFVLILQGIIALIPNLSAIVLPTGFTEWFVNIVNGVGYFLPLSDFFAMMAIWILVTNFQIVWKILQRIWDALPFT